MILIIPQLFLMNIGQLPVDDDGAADERNRKRELHCYKDPAERGPTHSRRNLPFQRFLTAQMRITAKPGKCWIMPV